MDLDIHYKDDDEFFAKFTGFEVDEDDEDKRDLRNLSPEPLPQETVSNPEIKVCDADRLSIHVETDNVINDGKNSQKTEKQLHLLKCDNENRVSQRMDNSDRFHTVDDSGYNFEVGHDQTLVQSKRSEDFDPQKDNSVSRESALPDVGDYETIKENEDGGEDLLQSRNKTKSQCEERNHFNIEERGNSENFTQETAKQIYLNGKLSQQAPTEELNENVTIMDRVDDQSMNSDC